MKASWSVAAHMGTGHPQYGSVDTPVSRDLYGRVVLASFPISRGSGQSQVRVAVAVDAIPDLIRELLAVYEQEATKMLEMWAEAVSS